MKAQALTAESKNMDVEVLRALAICMTLFAHLEILIYWGSGFLASLGKTLSFWGGVDLFFCISGFVITGSLLRDPPSSAGFAIFAIPFWIRRFWRLTPSALIWLIVVIALSASPISQGYLRSATANATDALYALTYLANFHFWSCYAGIADNCGVNQVYWSLSLEEQCYLIIPIALFLLGRRKFAAFLLLVFAAQAFLTRPILSLGWFLRTDALALGAMIALASRYGRLESIEPKLLGNRAIAIFLLLACIAVAGLFAGAWKSFPLHTTGIALVSGLLVWIASYGKAYLGLGKTSYRLWAYLGSRSYAIYLAHVPIYYLARPLAGHLGYVPNASHFAAAGYLIAALLTVFILAELNYRFVELPLRNYGRIVANSWSARRTNREDVAPSS